MEGKALLFKLFGGVGAVPLCIRARDAVDIVHAVELIEPSFGGINLEDISQPKCFAVLDEARQRVSLPVWHDDQQGSATVALAGLLAAAEVVGKPLDKIRIVLFGVGAANVATYRLLIAYGVDPKAIIACDTGGILHPARSDIERKQAQFVDKWRICLESNGDNRRGASELAFKDADEVPRLIRINANLVRRTRLWPWNRASTNASPKSRREIAHRMSVNSSQWLRSLCANFTLSERNHLASLPRAASKKILALTVSLARNSFCE